MEDHESKFLLHLNSTSSKTIWGLPGDLSGSNFLKKMSLSPDGRYFLLCSDNMFYSIPMPIDVDVSYYDAYQTNEIEWKPLPTDFSSFFLQEYPKGESIYDYTWWPGMNSYDCTTCCFITSRRDHPIHLIDATTGALRSTYRMHNQMDTLESATSLSFNLTGDKIYAGCNRMIRIFDVNYPGNNYTSQPTTKTRRDPSGQKGLISCLAFNPDYSGSYAAGSYGQSVGIYVENDDEVVLELNELGFGVSYLKWSPCGRYLWVGGRNSSYISCWDLRGTRTEVGRVRRTLSTNQRLSFDLDPWGAHLITGSEDGDILVYNTKTFECVATYQDKDRECIHSVVVHPILSNISYCTGQRHFPLDKEEDIVPSSSLKTLPIKEYTFHVCSDFARISCPSVHHLLEMLM